MTLAATLAAAAVLPSAPLLVPGVSARPPAVTDAVREAIDEAVAALPPHDLRILLAGASGTGDAGVYLRDRADLGGLSRPELSVTLGTPGELAAALCDATGLAPLGSDVPVDLAVLALHAACAGDVPTVALALPWSEGAALLALGARLGEALPARRTVVIAAGDLSAGLGSASPRPGASGGQEWNNAALAALGGGDAIALAGLGPTAAAAAAARGWPALTVLLGVLASTGMSLTVHCAEAPRGVGYVVAGT